MNILFEETRINGMPLSNRFIRSATWAAMAEEKGAVTPQLIDLLTGLADGGVGLIITGHAYVSPEGQAGPWQLAVYDDSLVPGLKDMTEAVHGKGGSIVLQLAHAGFYARTRLTGREAIAPSLIEGVDDEKRKEMAPADIRRLVRAFAEGAGRAKAAEFDGVQIHCAHGYLLSQFLSPLYNRRTDEYGGDIRERARFLMEVLTGIREEVGWAYPVMIKLNCRDFADNGLSLEDSLAVGEMLEIAGIDAIELSGGLPTNPRSLGPTRTGIGSEAEEGYFREEAKAFKGRVDVPVSLVGGIRSFGVAESLVLQGTADYISMCRPLIREPHLLRRWKEGDLRKSACISDNQCFRPAMAGKGVCCVHEKEETA